MVTEVSLKILLQAYFSDISMLDWRQPSWFKVCLILAIGVQNFTLSLLPFGWRWFLFLLLLSLLRFCSTRLRLGRILFRHDVLNANLWTLKLLLDLLCRCHRQKWERWNYSRAIMLRLFNSGLILLVKVAWSVLWCHYLCRDMAESIHLSKVAGNLVFNWIHPLHLLEIVVSWDVRLSKPCFLCLVFLSVIILLLWLSCWAACTCVCQNRWLNPCLRLCAASIYVSAFTTCESCLILLNRLKIRCLTQAYALSNTKGCCWVPNDIYDRLEVLPSYRYAITVCVSHCKDMFLLLSMIII